MKIGIIGAHGVGKTSISHGVMSMVKREGVNSHMITEGAYKCPHPLRIGNESTVESQIWILMDQIRNEVWADSLFDVVLCDRTAVDNFAYLEYNLRRGAVSNEQTRNLAEPLRDFVVKWSRTYDQLLYVPCPRQRLTLNPMQNECLGFRDEIDASLTGFMETNGIEYVRLPDLWSRGEAAAVEHVRGILHDRGYIK